MIKKFSKYIILLAVVGISISCSVKFPRAISENPMGSLIGKATKTTYLGIFSVGDDTSIELAAKNGNIKYITSVDYQYTDILGIIGTQTVIVTGSAEAPSNPEVATNSTVNKVLEKPAPKQAEKQFENYTQNPVTDKADKSAEKVNETESQVTKSVKEKSNNSPNLVNSQVTNGPKSSQQMEDVTSKKNEVPALARNNNNNKNNITESVEKTEMVVPETNTTSQRKIKGFSIKAKTISELASKIKSMSNEFMQYGDLNPVDIKLNVNTLSFSCNFKTQDTGFIKLGLYFGPKSTGCESCENVLNNNAGSVVVNQGISNVFAYQLIAIYSK